MNLALYDIVKKEQIEVYIVDDHSLMAEGLSALITSAGFAVAGISYDGRSAVENVISCKPQIILMDLDLPEINGLEAMRQILKKWTEARIIIISMHLEKILIERSIKMGAMGYLPKNVSREEFIHAIQQVSNGRSYYASETTRSLALGERVNNNFGAAENIVAAAALSPRESEVLKSIVAGLSNREIAEKLHLSSHTIDTHRKNIMKKTGSSNTAELIGFAFKAGIVQ